MDEKDQTELFHKLTQEAESQVKETLERLRAVCAEAATEAARTATRDAFAQITGVEQKILQFLADSTATAATHLQDAIKTSEDARGRIAVIQACIEEQSSATVGAVAQILDVQQNILQTLADSTAAASNDLQDATKTIEDATRRIGVIEARVEEQGGLMRVMLKGLLIVAIIVLLILVAVFVR